MREIRQSGSEGGVVGNGHPYPYTVTSWARLPGEVGMARETRALPGRWQKGPESAHGDSGQ